MSSMSALGVVPDRRPVVLAEFRNAHGWSPSIWQRLMVHHGMIEPGGYIFNRGEDLDRLWQSIDDLPEWQQIPLVLTFDTGVIPFQAFAQAADLLNEFDGRLPAPEGHVNHVPGVAALLRSGPEVPFFGIYGTSVTDNPFDPWDDAADDWGSGIPANDWFVLPQHRQMALDVIGRKTEHLEELDSIEAKLNGLVGVG